MLNKLLDKKIFLFEFFILILIFSFGFIGKAEAATNIYYSVGQNTSDHKTGTPTVTIADGIATFSEDQTATNMGVGDIINYGGQRAFITGKISSSVWSVSTATGTMPAATTSAPVTSITHAFASLQAAIGVGISGNATSTNFLNTSDLVTGNFILNIPCYYDTGPDTNSVTINGITTDPDHYIRIYTATSTTSEVNQSQRHRGKWDTLRWMMDGSFHWTSALTVKIPYVYLDGLQFRNSTANGSASTVNYNVTADDNIRISNSIFRSSSQRWYALYVASGSLNSHQMIWNNVFADASQGLNLGDASHAEVYNNTFYNNSIGVYEATYGTPDAVYKNNIFASTTNPFSTGGLVANGTDYNSTDKASMGYVVVGGGNNNDLLNQTFTFVDIDNYDFHLTSNNPGAVDVGVSLVSDPNLPFNTDYDGETRPVGAQWDRGADEYSNVDINPPVISNGSPASNLDSGTTSTTISVTTNESATCKYSTTTNTVYGDMTNELTSADGRNHTADISGLSDGHKYHYYIRCQDESNNANTVDYEISFWVLGNTFYPESSSLTDVQAAINVASSGNTIQLPAGTYTWGDGGTGLSVNKAVTVQGAGQDSTIIQLSTTGRTVTNGTIYISAAATVKDFTILAPASGNSTTPFSASNANGWRITNVKYDATGQYSYFIYVQNAYGLIDHCTIIGGGGSNELIFVRGPTNSWQTPSSIGGKDNLFVEDNTFSGSGYVSDCNSNSRCVFRNNIINGQMKIDGHGIASNSPPRGVRHMEIYNNTWTVSGTQAAMELRGGTGMIFNNTGTNAGLILNEYCAISAYSNCGGVILDADDYPIDDQIGVGMDPKVAASEPMYLWLNRNSGNIWNISLGYGNNAQLSSIIVSDRDYYIEKASFDGTSGIGSGSLSARPSTCTTGVGYWATDQGTNWDISNGASNDGEFYKCTATNTWTAYYVPYAYPHYLTATSITGTNKVDTGEGARMFGNGKFYGIATTSPSGITADIAVTPGTTADAWVDISISTWSNTGTRHKVWTELMPTLKSTTTVHVIGDLKPNTNYDVKVDGILGANITGDNCTGGVCVSDSNGRITFTYTGGYSEHEFDVEETDTTPPVRSAGLPSGTQAAGTTQVTLSLTTDENATCKYSTSAGTAYASMTGTFSTTGGTTHSTTITGLSNGNSYNYYVRCTDGSNVNSDDYTISFSIASSGGGGIISGLGGLYAPIIPSQTTTKTTTKSNQIAQTSSTPSNSALPAFVFTADLKAGFIGNSVKQLQIFLNSDPDTRLAKSGPGSPGKETNIFGSLTKAAVIKFQEKYAKDILAPWGLTKGTGFVGKTTRAKINELIGKNY